MANKNVSNLDISWNDVIAAPTRNQVKCCFRKHVHSTIAVTQMFHTFTEWSWFHYSCSGADSFLGSGSGRANWANAARSSEVSEHGRSILIYTIVYGSWLFTAGCPIIKSNRHQWRSAPCDSQQPAVAGRWSVAWHGCALPETGRSVSRHCPKLCPKSHPSHSVSPVVSTPVAADQKLNWPKNIPKP